jgi:hypothetical protein
MDTLTNAQLALRALILAAICADRKDRQDAPWVWADAALRELAPEINRRF